MNHSHKRCHKRGWAWESKGLGFVFVHVGVCFRHSLVSSESSFVLRVSVLQHVFNSACFTLALGPNFKTSLWCLPLTVLFAYEQEACKNKECSAAVSEIY